MTIISNNNERTSNPVLPPVRPKTLLLVYYLSHGSWGLYIITFKVIECTRKVETDIWPVKPNKTLRIFEGRLFWSKWFPGIGCFKYLRKTFHRLLIGLFEWNCSIGTIYVDIIIFGVSTNKYCLNVYCKIIIRSNFKY